MRIVNLLAIQICCCLHLLAQSVPPSEIGAEFPTSKTDEPPILPAAPVKAPLLLPSEAATDNNVNWSRLLLQSGFFLGIQHGFRLGTEKGTRDGLHGQFFDNYARSLGNLHGWADGDEFYVNYIGHPIQGSVANFIFIQNDKAQFRYAQFGKNRDYWKSRLRALAFSSAYSAQFEIGPISEASIGAIQSQYPQQGLVDLVAPPTP